jgi:phosphatidyl-myo-inositol dimannoside synthase
MRKTLLLTHEYYPFRGGVARYCYTLFHPLDPASYVVVTDQAEFDETVPITRVQFLASWLRPRWLYGLIVTYTFVKKNSIKVIFTPNVLPLGIIALLIKKVLHIPYVVSLHGLDLNLALHNKKAQLLKILKNAQHIVTNSDELFEKVSQLDLGIPVTTLTPSVETSGLTIDSTALHSLHDRYNRKKVVLSVGRLIRRKGQDTVIRALKEIRASVPEAHYVIIGRGPDEDYLKQLAAEQGVSENVTIQTDVSNSELAAYYSIASVFVMPSRRIGDDIEGFGIVFVEAATFGLPIIAGQDGGEREAIGAAGMYVDGESSDEIVRAVITMLSDPERARERGAQIQAHVESLPSADEQAQKLMTILS